MADRRLLESGLGFRLLESGAGIRLLETSAISVNMAEAASSADTLSQIRTLAATNAETLTGADTVGKTLVLPVSIAEPEPLAVTPTAAASTTISNSGQHSSVTFNANIPSGSDFVGIDVTADNNVTRTITSVTVGGVAATQTGYQSTTAFGSVTIRAGYGLVSPPTGASVAIVVTYSGNEGTSLVAARPFSGVDPTTPMAGWFASGVLTSFNGTKSFSPAVSPAVGDYLMGSFTSPSASAGEVATLDNELVENYDSNSGLVHSIADSAVASMSETLDWTNNQFQDYIGHVFIIKAASNSPSLGTPSITAEVLNLNLTSLGAEDYLTYDASGNQIRKATGGSLITVTPWTYGAGGAGGASASLDGTNGMNGTGYLVTTNDATPSDITNKVGAAYVQSNLHGFKIELPAGINYRETQLHIPQAWGTGSTGRVRATLSNDPTNFIDIAITPTNADVDYTVEMTYKAGVAGETLTLDYCPITESGFTFTGFRDIWLGPELLQGNLSDTVSQTTSSGTFPVTMAESGTALETVNRTMSAPVAISETGSAIDTLTKNLITALSITENLSAAETNGSSLIAAIAIVEALSPIESATSSLIAALSVTETGSAIDTQSQSTGGNFSVVIAETGSAAETLTKSLIAPVSITETGSALEALTKNLSAALSIVEAPSATDTISAVMAGVLVITETFSATDTLSSQLTALLNIAESSSIVESINKNMSVLRAISETAPALDTPSAVASYLLGVIETANVLDIVTAALLSSEYINTISADAFFSLVDSEIARFAQEDANTAEYTIIDNNDLLF